MREYKPCSNCGNISNKLGVGLCPTCYHRAWRKDKEEWKKYKLEYFRSHKLEHVAARRKSRYGITQDEYNLLLEKQEHKCAICKSSKTKRKRSESFHVDHNHNTRKVRGLLCNSCNMVLGFAEDNIKVLENAIQYLKNYERNTLQPITN